MKSFKDFIMENDDNSKLVGPFYHRTTADINKLSDFDISKASKNSVLGPALYASLEGGSWNPGHLKNGKTLKGHVRGHVIDLTQPQPQEHLDKLSNLLGKKVDVPPFTTLEKRFGSVAEGLRQARFSAAIHEGPGKAGRHIAVFDMSKVVDHGQDKKD